MKKKVLVIGGNGFVGRNINLPANDYEAHSLDLFQNSESLQKYSSYSISDIRDSKSAEVIDDCKPDILVVLAGKQFESPIQKRSNRSKSFGLNQQIAESLTEFVMTREWISKVIYVSTDMVYGVQNESLLGETTPVNPVGEYGRSKYEAEQIFSVLGEKLIILRPRLIVGPGRAGTVELLTKFIRLRMPIPIIGNGNNRYQLISVSDLWEAIDVLISKNASGIFNIGSDNPPRLNDLLPNILENIGARKLILHLPKSLTVRLLELLDRIGLSPLAPEQFLIAGQDCVLNTMKLRKLGWRPKYSDEDILSQTIRELL